MKGKKGNTEVIKIDIAVKLQISPSGDMSIVMTKRRLKWAGIHSRMGIISKSIDVCGDQVMETSWNTMRARCCYNRK